MTSSTRAAEEEKRVDSAEERTVPGERILEATKEKVRQQPSICHSDGPSYNDHSGDTTHNKAGG